MDNGNCLSFMPSLLPAEKEFRRGAQRVFLCGVTALILLLLLLLLLLLFIVMLSCNVMFFVTSCPYVVFFLSI